ncbi:MFS transporter [Haloechinothrix alba]|uniref:MFS transporter n=1 Tax=Haloechinothrix alba TaxID=664784 RepID=UPI003CCC1E81
MAARGADVRAVTAAVFAAGVASFALLYAPQPVLPQIAGEFGLDAGSASLAVSVATGALAVAVLPIATLSEVVGRRPVIACSLAVSVLMGALIPLVPSFTVLLVMRAVQGAAIAGFPGVAAAFLAERLGARGVAGAVGAMVAGNTIGGMLGRLATGVSADWLGWRAAMACSAVLALACAVVAGAALVRLNRRVPADGPASEQDREVGVLRGLGAALASPVLLAQYSVALLGMGAFVALYNAASFRLTGDPFHLAPAVASMVFLAYAMGTVSSSLAGRLVGRFGRTGSLLGALAGTVLGAMMTLAGSLPVVIAGFVVLTAGFFAAHAVSSGWTASAARRGGRGQASGLYTLAYYVGSSVGGTVGSVVFARAGWGALIVMVTAWLGCAVLAVLAVRSRDEPRVPAPVGCGGSRRTDNSGAGPVAAHVVGPGGRSE